MIYIPSITSQTSLLVITLYAVLLTPISVSFFNSGVSANYLFVILLLGPLKYVKNNYALVYITYCVICLAFGMFLFSNGDDYFLLRQFISFGVFLIGLLILFVRLPGSLDDFLHAVVLVSFIYSAYAIFVVMFYNFSLQDMYMIKGGLRSYVSDWPQRYVVVLIFGFFVTLSNISKNKYWLIPTIVILICIFLTYTRAAWLAVFMGLISQMVFIFSRGNFITKLTSFSIMVCFGALSVYFLTSIPVVVRVIEAISELGLNIVNVLLSFGQVESVGSTSERLALWISMLEIISVNPITGSGFAGVYLFADGQGSSHNQILDVFFRTGGIGLLFYGWLWLALFAFYKKFNIGVFSGLVAVFVFGFFHETTKLSYGAVIFFVLLNKMYEFKSLAVASVQSKVKD